MHRPPNKGEKHPDEAKLQLPLPVSKGELRHKLYQPSVGIEVVPRSDPSKPTLVQAWLDWISLSSRKFSLQNKGELQVTRVVEEKAEVGYKR